MNEKTDRVKFTPSEPHATRCAAEIVAKADNGVCGVGVAPLSNISSAKTRTVLPNTLTYLCTHKCM